MYNKVTYILLKIAIIQVIIIVNKIESKRECVRKQIENSNTVCVCNSSYCDDFPPIVRPKAGVVLVYESNRIGDRFKANQIRFKQINSYVKSSKAVNNQIIITVNRELKYQRIYGFGGAFTDSTGHLLRSVDKRLATAIIDSYFSSNGIQYSFGRVPIAGTDFSLRPYTYDDIYNDKNLTYFALQSEDFKYKIPYIKEAQNVCAHSLKLIATNWSPPVWMKDIEQIVGFSQLKGEVGGQYYQILANYLVKFLQSYKQNGIDFWGLTTQNEPVESHELNCLQMTPYSQEVFVQKNLGPTLANAGFNKNQLKLMIIDDNIPFLKNWTDIILTDRENEKYVSGIASHWYYNELIGSEVESTLDYVHHNHPDYFMLNTEACILDGPGNGKWDYAERYAFDIIRQLNHWVVGWMEWNMVLDLTAGPTWFERLGCGGPVYVDKQVGEAYKQPTFYALGHFSKFISPDSIRIGQELDVNIDNIYVLTVKRPDNGIVVIVLNRNDNEINVNLKFHNNYITNRITAHSIQTYIWWH